MKTRILKKKLFINKETVSNLGHSQMDNIKGGITNTCFFWSDDSCPYPTETSIPYQISLGDLKTRCEICIP